MICSICLCSLGRKKFKTTCGHCFHSKCLLQWVLDNDLCPMCRFRIRSIAEEDLYEEPLDLTDEIEISQTQVNMIREIYFLIIDIISRRR